MTRFRDDMEAAQLAWKRRALPHVEGQGRWQKRPYDHILPEGHAQENLWPGIRADGAFPLDAWLADRDVQAHTGRDNLLSSWTLAANLYFPFGRSAGGLRLAADFLRANVDASIADVRSVELEWEHADGPAKLLGEAGGRRGSHQTSPDVAFKVTTTGGGDGVVLTEVKFTEHDFYACSVRKQLDDATKSTTCDALARLRTAPAALCGQHTVKGRRYWDHLATILDWDAPLRGCPAATAAYQLFRQQALAEALAARGDQALVVSSLAYDARNAGLLASLRRTGRAGAADAPRDVRTDWSRLFRGKARFATFSHQSWVAFVRQASPRPAWCADWLAYVTDRYGL